MKPQLLILAGLLLVFYSCQNANNKGVMNKDTNARQISFFTPDSIEIFGDLYESDKKEDIILLFHQGGSNARGEYGPIIPRLLEKEVNILAIDQRMGGQFYGSYNRTIANIPDHSFDNPYNYCDAYNNLESALDFVISSGFTGKKIVWGSSYSASLAIQLANKNQKDISGVFAFSPAYGDPMKECLPDKYLETLNIPLLILRPPSEMENESAQKQLKLANKYNHQTYIAKPGVHGSSMLVEERVGHDVSEHWDVVFSFLKEVRDQ